nr:MAG TPA: hypothetical protein [Caudoviricetes sp.]
MWYYIETRDLFFRCYINIKVYFLGAILILFAN